MVAPSAVGQQPQLLSVREMSQKPATRPRRQQGSWPGYDASSSAPSRRHSTNVVIFSPADIIPPTTCSLHQIFVTNKLQSSISLSIFKVRTIQETAYMLQEIYFRAPAVSYITTASSL